MTDYGAYIDPIAVRSTAVKIVAPIAKKQAADWLRAAAIFDFARQQISCVDDPVGTEYVAPPAETLECSGGDCEDHAILVASLCEAVGIPAGLGVFRWDGGAHACCLVDVLAREADATELERDLSAHYQQRQVATTAGYASMLVEGRRLYIADSALGQYFGDVRQLRELIGEEPTPGDFRWKGTVQFYRRHR